PLDLGLDIFSAGLESLDRTAAAVISGTLRDLNSGEVVPAHRALVQRWRRHLGKPNGSTPSEKPDWARARELWPGAPQLVDYLERCARLLPGILRGDESPLQTLFPGGNLETADFLYRDWAVAGYFNAVAAALLSSAAGGRPTGPFRVLEVGAGTGGMTSAILPRLPG